MSQDEDAIVREIMARGQAKTAAQMAKDLPPVPEDLMPYDWEVLQLEKVAKKLEAQQGLYRDVEKFRQEIIERFAAVNWRVEPEIWSTTQEGLYAFDINLTGRITPISKTGESDFERRQWEVRNDILEIAPEFEKGQTVPFHEGMVHDPSFAHQD